MISVSGLEKTFGSQTLFRGATFQLNPGERYGLVGANGSGKTTLLKILSGDLDPSGGSVTIPSRTSLGVLRQDQFLYEDELVLGVAMMGNPELWSAMVEKEQLLARAEHSFDADRFSALEEVVERHDGYAAEARAAEILEGLGLPAEVHRQPLSVLSGGFKLRVLLAQALAGNPDVLLLDEPTNHLDVLSIRWLEKFLRAFAGPVVVISHDHRFLDNVATHVLDVDYETVLLYPGNYSDFLRAKALERTRREKDIQNREREIAHHQKFVDRFRAKASKARQAQSKLRLIEKKAESLQALPASSRRYPTFKFSTRRPSGREVLRLEGIGKAYSGKSVLDDVDLSVMRGDRVAIMGPNGIGKSTLLKIAVGEVVPDAGDVEWGYEAHPGYFAQDHHEQIEGAGGTVEGWISGYCDGRDRGYVRGQLGLVLFSGDEAEKRLDALSGGEAARLVFCRLAVERPNVLVLDEPTNHLDLESIEALVEGLLAYEGTIILVSHDRWFVSRLANRIVEITPEGMRDYAGTYEEYVHACGDDHLDVDALVLKAKKASPQANGRRRSKPKRRESPAQAEPATALAEERDRVTARIEEAEARIAAIDQAFLDPGILDGGRSEEVQRLRSERLRLETLVGELMEEWERAEEAIASALASENG